MSGQLQVGAVLHWDDFEFPDGTAKDKYLVLLGAKTGSNYLMVVATSKQHRRKLAAGCHAGDGYYFIPGGAKDFFPKDTWLVLSEPVEASAPEVLKRAFAKTLCVAGSLRKDIANAVRNCLRQVQDVSRAHLDLL